MMVGTDSNLLMPSESNFGKHKAFRVTVVVGTLVLVLTLGLAFLAKTKTAEFDPEAIIQKSQGAYFTKCPGYFLSGFPPGDKGHGETMDLTVAKLWCTWNIDCQGVTCDSSGKCTFRSGKTFIKSLTQETTYWRQKEQPMSGNDRAPNCPPEPAATTLLHPALSKRLASSDSIDHQRVNFVSACVSDLNVTNHDGLGIDESVLRWIHGFQWVDMCRNYFDKGIGMWEPFTQMRARPTRDELLRLATMKNFGDAEWWGPGERHYKGNHQQFMNSMSKYGNIMPGR